jgi:hypothetical protein
MTDEWLCIWSVDLFCIKSPGMANPELGESMCWHDAVLSCGGTKAERDRCPHWK